MDKGELSTKENKKTGKDKYTYVCRKCKYCKSIFKGSILQGSKIQKNKFILLVFLWIQEVPLKSVEINTGLSHSTVVEWNRILLEILIRQEKSKPVKMIGGPGIVVEIDESKFGRRKYNVSLTKCAYGRAPTHFVCQNGTTKNKTYTNLHEFERF